MRLLALFAAMTLVPSLAAAADSWTTPHPGIRRLHRTTTNQNINVLVVDLCTPGVSVRATKSGERQRTVSSFASLVGAQAAINGDFFSFQNYSTNGPSMGDGAAWGGSDHNYVAPVQFGQNQVALPAHESTAGVEPWARQVVSGHPSLIVGGTKRDNTGDTLCTARHPRTVLGLTADRRTLILAVVDGRATNRIGMTCAELGNLMAEFGATDAVNLDGGGSSAMWVAGPGVVNVPSDGSQRVVANHLAVRATGSGDAPHCTNPRFDASFVGVQAPIELTSGEEAVVYLELDNQGDTAWTPSITRVGTQDPQDRESVFFKEENWVSKNRPTGADKTYAPGATGRFTWAMVAPDVDRTTTFDETYQLVQEGVTWFGPKHTMSIIVHPTSGPTPPDEEPPPGGEEDAPESSGCATTGATSPLLLLALSVLLRRRRKIRRRKQLA
ncbi:MAG TPA: phosphodiester glycosidase family protein [Kofleriaceae bacterium]|nr:phosphodiester glycosidase family protein [Kofleriaceae bacterium]